jgi:two-component system response regulator YesN
MRLIPVKQQADANSDWKYESTHARPRTIAMNRSTSSTIPPQRLRDLSADLRRKAPDWANRLSNARTNQELLGVVCKLFNLSSVLAPSRSSSLDRRDLFRKIRLFIGGNLHRDLTLKILAQFLGCSEKYCSVVVRSTMGESFSRYLKRRRIETAVSLLTTSDKSLADIASALGFSDQLSFSRFFRKATGQSPREFRGDSVQYRPRRISLTLSRPRR